MIGALLDLLVGTTCPICATGASAGSPGALCVECRARLLARLAGIRRVEVPSVPAPVWAAGSYDDDLRIALISWKERARHALTPDLGLLAAASVLGVLGATDHGPDHGAGVDGAVKLVPIPTTKRSARSRGVDLCGELARATARQLTLVGSPEVEPANLLTFRRQPRDQSGLGADDRRTNLQDSMVAVAGSQPVVVVDDIVTTGSTLREAVTALASAGHRVIGCAAIARADRVGF